MGPDELDFDVTKQSLLFPSVSENTDLNWSEQEVGMRETAEVRAGKMAERASAAERTLAAFIGGRRVMCRTGWPP